MRVILKPGGSAVLLTAIGLLTFLAVRRDAPTPPQANAATSQARSTLTKPRVTVVGSEDFWRVYTPTNPKDGTVVVTTAADLPLSNKQAVRAVINNPVVKKPWAIQFGPYIPQSVKVGDVFDVHFWARSKTRSRLQFVFEQGKEPYYKENTTQLTLTPEWKEYVLPVRSQRAYLPNEAQVRWQVARDRGIIEVGGYELRAGKRSTEEIKRSSLSPSTSPTPNSPASPATAKTESGR